MGTTDLPALSRPYYLASSVEIEDAVEEDVVSKRAQN